MATKETETECSILTIPYPLSLRMLSLLFDMGEFVLRNVCRSLREKYLNLLNIRRFLKCSPAHIKKWCQSSIEKDPIPDELWQLPIRQIDRSSTPAILVVDIGGFICCEMWSGLVKTDQGEKESEFLKRLSRSNSTFHSIRERITNLKKWFLLQIVDGYFCVLYSVEGQVIKHKTFHEYKPNKSNSSHRQNKLRTTNDKFSENVKTTLTSWKHEINDADIVGYFVSGKLFYSLVFGSNKKKDGFLSPEDPRLIQVPVFGNSRPSLENTLKLYTKLTSIKFYSK
eukprot:TRINITY_DN841_c0_g2_i1.p1 TRINITY_DN841_c0_g2~~TRINITY_DN841_c0_g2_i1.p1  ORF type:complete len:283 (-),score=10.78 TRINITY_DN841_c0_g2_i1:84-932(-)